MTNHGIQNDTYTLMQYHVLMINDTISELRKGRKAYLYKLEDIKEVLPFVPDLKVNINDGACELYVSKRKEI